MHTEPIPEGISREDRTGWWEGTCHSKKKEVNMLHIRYKVKLILTNRTIGGNMEAGRVGM